MKQHSENREVKVMGIDLAKNSLQVYGVDANGHKAVGKKLGAALLKRQQFLKIPSVIEASIGQS